MTVTEYQLIRRSDGVIVFRLFVSPTLPGPVVPDWIVRDCPDYEPDDYEWRNTATDERQPAQPIRRWVYMPAEEDSP